MKKEKSILFYILAFVNVTILVLFFLDFQEAKEKKHREVRENTKLNIIKMMFDQLELNETQQSRFYELTEDFREKSHIYIAEQHRLKREILEESFSENPDTSKIRENTIVIGVLQTKLEKLISKNFFALKDICNEKQKEKFEFLIQDVHRRNIKRTEIRENKF